MSGSTNISGSTPNSAPGRALSLESIVTGARVFPYRDRAFWDAYRNDPAWEFARFLDIAERGKPRPAEAAPGDREGVLRKEREDLEASLAYTKRVLGIAG